jgi:DNA invertase Pin-like site-specific DNA recombinase
MSRERRPAVRCAIYTRKSTEEGLDQAFNTLDAQREASEAYIKSQAGEGWRALPARYDDGGYSGGSMDRPALKRLLADVEAGKVDTIVVYKVDRLTRSLMDFARIVETLDDRNVSFVSVTQAFNTTTSMGRLTLNVLLSFAQFEREVTGERIRDKVAASKAKGMWMGGNVALGYDLGDRVLVVNEVEARQVTEIFRGYLELGSVPALAKELQGKRVFSKAWVSRTGNSRGGLPLRCGALYYILQNRLYVGEIVHRGTTFRGEHEPIVSEELFEAVQQKLARNRRSRREQPGRAAACLLLGRVVDADGGTMRSSFSYGSGGKCYRYYCSSTGKSDDATERVNRVAAGGLDRWVVRTITCMTGRATLSPSEVLEIVARVELHRRTTQLLLNLRCFSEPHEEPSSVMRRLQPRLIEGRLAMEGEGALRLIVDRRAVFRGGARQSPQIASRHGAERTEQVLRASHQLLLRHGMSPLDLHRHPDATAPETQRIRRLLGVGLLAPDIQRAIIERRCPAKLEQLTSGVLPLAWADQRLSLA